MALFTIAYEETARIEAGYANNPKDPGRETWRGIARKKNPSWPGWVIVDSMRNKRGWPGILADSAQLQNLVQQLYKAKYWDVLRLDQVKTQKIANKLYDISVNIGPETAALFLQRALNLINQNGRYYPDLKVDGVIGERTIGALNSHPRQDVVFKVLNVMQGNHYIQITTGNVNLEDFINGWFEQRVAAIQTADHSDIA